MDMLSRRTGGDYREAEGEASAPASISDLIERLTGLARRQYHVLLIGPAAAIAIGLLYLLITPAQYTATATLLIDSSTLRVLQNQLQPQGDIPLDTLQVGSQVEILASRKIALAVIKRPQAGRRSRIHRNRPGYLEPVFAREPQCRLEGGQGAKGARRFSEPPHHHAGRNDLCPEHLVHIAQSRRSPPRSPMRSPKPISTINSEPSTRR